MSTGRKVGILAVVVLFGGIATYWASQGDGAGPRISNAQTADDEAADDRPTGGVHEDDPSMTGDRSADDDRRNTVLDALRDTARPSGGEREDNDGGAVRDASTEGGRGGDNHVDGAASADADGPRRGGGEMAWPALNTGENVGAPAPARYPPETDRDPFSSDDLPADAVAAAGGDGDAASQPPTPADGVDGADGEDATDDGESDDGFTPRRWTQRTDDGADDEPIGPPARDRGDGAGDSADDADGSPNTYTVQPGDSLWIIASKTLGSGAKWQRIADANPDVDKNTVLRPGMKLLIPGGERASEAGPIPEPRQVAEPTARDPLGLGLDREVREVTVRENESLWTIAQREYGDGTKWRVIYLANRDRMDDEQDLHPGDKLRVPPLPEDD